MLLQLACMPSGRRARKENPEQPVPTARRRCDGCSSTRFRRQSVSQPIRLRKIPHGHRRPAPSPAGQRGCPRADRGGAGCAERALLARALAYAEPLYAGQLLSTGEPTWVHALGLGANLAAIGLDAPGRAAGVLFAATKNGDPDDLRAAFGEEIASLVAGVEKLYQLRVATRGSATEQNEVLRKMVLGMVEDVRVVLIRLASRTQTLRWFSKNREATRRPTTRARRSTSTRRSPTASACGSSSGSSRTCRSATSSPSSTRRSRGMLDEKRLERQQYIADAISALEERAGEERGRGRDHRAAEAHLLDLEQDAQRRGSTSRELYDVRALRVIVPEVKDCYTALGVVHNLWQPIPHEFDDYISRPKGNLYQSLHTAVLGPAGKTLEVQIRTEEMHRQAEYGIAAHWRYKESGKSGKGRERVRAEDRLAARAARVARRGLRLAQDHAAGQARRHGLRAHARRAR